MIRKAELYRRLERKDDVIDQIATLSRRRALRIAAFIEELDGLKEQLAIANEQLAVYRELAKKVPGLEKRYRQAIESRAVAWDEVDQLKKTTTLHVREAQREVTRVVTSRFYALWKLILFITKRGGETHGS